MSKKSMKPGAMLSPLPAVMVSCGQGAEANIITIAWTGITCSDPPMTYVSIKPERHSHGIISREKEFVINLVPTELAKQMDHCGCTSGSKENKWSSQNLRKEKADIVSCPMIAESPVNLECKVTQVLPLGSHDMFLAEIVAVHVDESLITDEGRIAFERLGLVSMIHGKYYPAAKRNIGRMGFSVMKPGTRKKLAGKTGSKADKPAEKKAAVKEAAKPAEKAVKKADKPAEKKAAKPAVRKETKPVNKKSEKPAAKENKQAKEYRKKK